MKKLLLALLCGTTVLFSACDQKNKPDQSHTAITQNLSQNNKSDIQQDLLILQKFSDLRDEQAIEFQDRFSSTLASQQSSEQVLQDVQQFFLESDKGLDALKIKSTEVDQRRQMLKKINKLTIQLTREAVAQQTDQKKMDDIQIQLKNLQQQLNENRLTLEKKLSKTAS